MDDRRTAHGMTDGELDCEIGRALRVDPSPEFLARVRTRIAAEPDGARLWWFRWQFLAMAAAAAVVVLAIATLRTHRQSDASATLSVLSARALDVGTIRLQSPDAVGLRSAEAVRARPAKGFALRQTGNSSERNRLRQERDGSGRAEPEVLIDPREAQALRAVIARVRSGRLDLSPVFNASTPTAMDLPPITDIVIEPIAIDPLAPENGAQGVRQ